MRTTKSSSRTSTKGTIKNTIVNCLTTNKNASFSTVFSQVMRKLGHSPSRITLDQYLRNSRSYPSFRGIYNEYVKISRQMRTKSSTRSTTKASS